MAQAGTPRQEFSSMSLWIQLLAGPGIWAVHFLASYLFVEAFCNLGWNFTLVGIHGLSFLLVTITIIAVVGSSLFALRSYRAWKMMNANHGLRDEFRETARWSEGPFEFMYFSGFLLSVVFTATILMVGIPAFFLSPCS